MSVSQALATPVDEIMESSELVPRNGFHLEPRCRMCRNDQRARKGEPAVGNRGQLRHDRARTRGGQRRTRQAGSGNDRFGQKPLLPDIPRAADRSRHVPGDPGAAGRENRVDFVEGVAIALTPMAFYEVVMAKAFRTLVDVGTEVSVETGLRAAEKLQSVLDGRERGTDVLELKVQLGQISEAVRAVVPQSMWAAIVDEAGGAGAAPGGARRRDGRLR